jgi:hypothetical protein
MRQLVQDGPEGSALLPSDCVPMAGPPRKADGSPHLATITGRILRRDNGLPLANAHLQMIGTPFIAFTDAQGWYTFRFDAALVEECRTQRVRVAAAGYRTQWVSVVVTSRIRSNDVLLEPGH